MNLFKITLSFYFLFLLAGCRKKTSPEVIVPASPEVVVPQKIDTIITHYSLNPLLKPYYNFADDSYWIYSDSTGKNTDSLFVQNFRLTNDTVKQLSKTTLTLHIYEACKYDLKSIKTVHNSLSVVASFNTIGVYTYWMSTYYSPQYPPIQYSINTKTCENENYDPHITYPSNEIKDCRILKDTLKLKNSKTYLQSSFFIHQDAGGYVVDVHHNLSFPLYSKSNWVANIGIVKLEAPYIDQIYYELLRYHVTQR